MKWLKLGGVSGVILLVLFILYFIIANIYFLKSDTIRGILLVIIPSLFLLFFISFVKLGSYVKSKFLMFSSGLMVFISFILFLFLIYTILNKPIGESGLGYAILLFYIIVSLGFGQILFSLSLISVRKKIKFSWLAGIASLAATFLWLTFILGIFLGKSSIPIKIENLLIIVPFVIILF